MKTSGKSWSRYIDKSIKAKKSGYRKSKETGERYYEDRPNHSDSDPKSKYAKGGAVSKSEKEKLSNMAYQLQNCSDSWISKNHGKFVEMQNEYKKQFKKVYGHNNYADPKTMAKGGLTEHGLKIGDKITGRNHGDKIEGYNKENRENFVTDIDKGKRSSMRYAKGGGVDYYEQLAVYVQGVGSIYNGTSMRKASDKARAYKKKKPNAEIVIVDEKYGDEYDTDGNFKNEYAKGGKMKKGKQDPPIVRGYFDDEPYEYAKGGEVGGIQIDNFKRNFMGTLSFDMKLQSMRKSQEFITYPVAEKTDYLTIQSSTRFGMIEMTTGRGLMSQSHSNGAYAYHFQTDKKVQFQLNETQLEELKQKLSKTAGANVGTRGIVSDNQYADKFADGGLMGGFTYSIGGL